MSADSPQVIDSAAPSSALVRIAGCACAGILVLVFAVQVYWATGDAGQRFRPMLGWPVTVALTTVWTLGAAALLLTRVGLLTLPVPSWLVRVAPWALTAFLALLALGHLVAVATRPSGDWQIDLQGPLLLLLAGLCIIVASEPASLRPRRRD